MSRRRVLLVQLSLQPPGGGNAVGAWMVHALTRDYDVSVLTWAPVDLCDVNRFYGTSIEAADITTYTVPSAVRRLVEAVPAPLHSLRVAVLVRTYRRLAVPFDVVISVDVEADFGRPALQYVSFPWTERWRRNGSRTPATRWFHRSLAVRPYFMACDAIASSSYEAVARNVTYSCSDWAANMVRTTYGFPARTLYPAVVGTFPEVPWAEREDGFVCAGRISPEKQLDRVIDILSAVRERYPHVRLHLAGTPSGFADYYRHILARVTASGGWITYHEDVSREALCRLIAENRYGIHGMVNEHFGIAVADLVRGGGIVFVPSEGGPREIVGADERLLFTSSADAVDKILRVLKDPEEQASLRARLATRRELFTEQRFMERVRGIVAGWPS